MEEVCHWRQALQVSSLPSHSLCFLLVAGDVTSQLPAMDACCHALPALWTRSGTISQRRFSSLGHCWYLATAITDTLMNTEARKSSFLASEML